MARPRQFDEDALLGAAVELFWTHGYDGTSIEDVARVSGVGNGSLYAAYTSKSGLYRAVVAHYCCRLTETVTSAMTGATGDVASSLREYLELIICDCIDQPGRRGCLMLNSIGLVDRMPELRPIIDRTTRQLQTVVTDRLRRDLEASGGDVDVVSLGAHYVTLSQGLIQRSRLDLPAAELRAIADASVHHLTAVAS